MLVRQLLRHFCFVLFTFCIVLFYDKDDLPSVYFRLYLLNQYLWCKTDIMSIFIRSIWRWHYFFLSDLNCVFWTHTACLAYGNAEAYLCCIYHKLAKCDGKRAVLGRRNSLPGRIITRSRKFKCSIDNAKRSFYRAANGVFAMEVCALDKRSIYIFIHQKGSSNKRKKQICTVSLLTVSYETV